MLEKYATEHGLAIADRKALCQHPDIIAMLTERIDTLQQDLAHYEKVKRFILIDEPFSIENGELTNTLKVKRRVVYRKYEKEINDMYEEAENLPH